MVRFTSLRLVKNRQSVRKYLAKAVPREILERCLEAARLAPSACNSQPWSFIVVDDPKLKNELAEAAFAGIYSTNAFAKKAPVIVVVVREQSNYAARLGGYFRNLQYSLIDIGIAGEHFVLQAEDLGLGTCWIGWFNEEAVKSLLNVPKDKKIDVLIALGYAGPKAVKGERKREPLKKMSSFNSY